MKAKFFCCVCVLLALTTAFAACVPSDNPPDVVKPETYDAAIELDVSTDLSAVKDISPYIYGQFIEHIPGCIYNGIWAEMIIDRKFYLPFGDMASPWTVNDSALAQTTADKTLSGDYAATLKQGGKLSQKVETDSAAYVGYVNAFSSAAATLRVTAKTKSEQKSTEFQVTSSDFAKYDFSFDLSADKNATITFECVSGELTMDSLSLMPADNIEGMRKDTLDLLKDMGGTIYRWPGGNFVSGYDWTDGIGDRDTRPNKRNLHYAGHPSTFSSSQEMQMSDRVKIIQQGFYSIIEPNDMGTDEFIAMCRYIDAEPYIVVNTGLGESDAAADWVEYCNGDVTTEYGAKRAQNGNVQPFGIVYWGVGNEMNGSHQLGYIASQNQYILKHDKFVSAMKQVDEGIKVFAVGDNYSDYTKNMMTQCVNKFDYVQEHFYALRDEEDLSKHVRNMYDGAYGGLSARIQKHRDLASVNRFGALMSLDEYAYSEVIAPSRLKDALGIGVALNLMIDNCDVVGMACYSSTVNAMQGCVTTTNTQAMYQGSGLVLKAYRKYMQSKQTTCVLKTDIDDVYVCATVSADGKTLSVAVVNATNKNLLVDGLGSAKVSLRASVVGTDIDVYNSEVNTNNISLQVTESPSKAIALAHSVSVLVFQL